MASPHDLRSFDRLLATVERGNLNAELSDLMQKVVEEIENHYQAYRGNPKAEITLKFKFERKGGANLKSGTPAIAVQASIASKMPVPPRDEELLFATPDNFLSKKDHTQPDLPLRDVNDAPQEARDIG